MLNYFSESCFVPKICKLQNHRSPLNTQPITQEQRHPSKFTYFLFCNSAAFEDGQRFPRPMPAHDTIRAIVHKQHGCHSAYRTAIKYTLFTISGLSS